MFGADDFTSAKLIRAGRAYITVDSKTMYAIGIQITFQRTAQILPTLSKDRVIAIGEPQGTLTIDSMVIDGGGLPDKIKNGDCKLDSITVQYSDEDGKCGNGQKAITCKNGIASAVTLNGNGQQGYIAQGFTFTFTDLEM